MSDSNSLPATKAALLSRIQQSWDKFHAYLRTLTDEQRTQMRDANRWAVKDFIIHLSTWERGVTSAMRKHTYAEGLEVEQPEFDQGVEHINTLLQQRYHHLTLDDALEMLRQSHEYLIATIHDLSDEDLMRPIREFDPTATRDIQLVRYIGGDSYAHYDEHIGWLTEMMASQNAKS